MTQDRALEVPADFVDNVYLPSRPWEVTMTADLREYHPLLSPGMKGLDTGEKFQGFRLLSFPTGDVILVEDSAYRITDPRWPAYELQRHQHVLSQLNSIRDIVVYEGPQGGFRGLRYKMVTSKREGYQEVFEYDRTAGRALAARLQAMGKNVCIERCR